MVAGPVTTVLTTHVYDHRGRLVDTRKQIDAQPEYIQSRLFYNQVGQLRQKKLHGDLTGSNFIDSVHYEYNERGWTGRIGSSRFTQVLRYNAPSSGAAAQYSGNISEQHWGHGTTTPNVFKYAYDGLDRLTDGQSTGTVMREELSYDVMGNISSLKRDGGTAISYTYTAGRLTSLSGGLTGSYTYDASGNAVTDRQGFAYTYNHLGQPVTAGKTGTSVGYWYDADGSKLRRTVTVGSTTTQRDYLREFEFHNFSAGSPAWQLLHTEEGYVQYNAGTGTYDYLYYLGDHLGNVRAVLRRTGAGTAVVEQSSDYYPYGLQKVVASGGINQYLYNGKELQGELGAYDYGARFYDPVIGRWYVIDTMVKFDNVSQYA